MDRNRDVCQRLHRKANRRSMVGLMIRRTRASFLTFCLKGGRGINQPSSSKAEPRRITHPRPLHGASKYGTRSADTRASEARARTRATAFPKLILSAFTGAEASVAPVNSELGQGVPYHVRHVVAATGRTFAGRPWWREPDVVRVPDDLAFRFGHFRQLLEYGLSARSSSLCDQGLADLGVPG